MKKSFVTKNSAKGCHTLADFIEPMNKKVSFKVCKYHKWKESRYNKVCFRCGISESK